MKFKLGCQLDYDVVTPTTLFLNIEAQGNDQQLVEAEALSIEPWVYLGRYQAPQSANIYQRALLQPGKYRIRYEADIRLSHLEHDPQSVAEVAVSQH